MAKQRFERKHLIKLARLLDMQYKPSEIAKEIGVTTETVYRSYLPGGCPFTRDKKNNDIWIHGTSFAAWVESVKERRHVGHLEDGEAWCFNCKSAVQMLKPKKRHEGRYTAIYQGRCAVCGAVVNRAYSASSAGPEATVMEVE